MKFRVCCFIAALAGAPTSASAASTYLETLQENFLQALDVNNDPRVPDDLEREVLKCLAAAFVKANVLPDDLVKLDQAAAAGTLESDPLAGQYAMMASDPGALALMAEEVTRMCPDTMKAHIKATS
jgi:hypothetical protein